MKRQARIGLRVAAGFLLVLLGLPLLNLYEPDLMATRIGGFSLTWLVLGMLLYPLMWVLSWSFVKGSDRIEEEIVRDFRGVPPTSSEQPTANPQPPTKKKLFVEEDAE